MMKEIIQIEKNPYRKYRDSKPWIGRVKDWPAGAKAVMAWGAFIGTPEDGGMLEIAAEAGDVIIWGQSKGSRKIFQYAIVGEDGGMTDVTPAEARKAWLARQDKPAAPANSLTKYTTAELLDEIERRGKAGENVYR